MKAGEAVATDAAVVAAGVAARAEVVTNTLATARLRRLWRISIPCADFCCEPCAQDLTRKTARGRGGTARFEREGTMNQGRCSGVTIK